jgi:predicted Zn-dependent protease
MKAMTKLGLLALAAMAMAGCATGGMPTDAVGVINKAWEKREAIGKTATALRKGFSDLSPEEEYFIGRAVAARILSDYKSVNDPERTNYINLVGDYVAKSSKMPLTFKGYHFMLISSDEVNAFAAPGGFIFITTGLYAKLASEEQLAAVLAHEVAHVSLKHGLSSIKAANLTQAFTILGTEAVKEYSKAQVGELTKAFENSINDIINNLVVNGYSRAQEYDADAEALATAYRAGYNPKGLSEFLKTLSGAKSANNAGFFKTHPPAGDRMTEADKIIASGKLQGEGDPARQGRFNKFAMK